MTQGEGEDAGGGAGGALEAQAHQGQFLVTVNFSLTAGFASVALRVGFGFLGVATRKAEPFAVKCHQQFSAGFVLLFTCLGGVFSDVLITGYLHVNAPFSGKFTA